ncbi:nucleotidyl transferase AbiEii/AbiGii toxin family protein [Piscirickettsia litoralis]|nr:nucleotidyl transferase AbiEii/AbiGii toxin family protein [Piscirickettsia litoralis]
MVEQDLIISRALICLYNDPDINQSLVFRGGTALNKLFIQPPARYSEDIDFVQQKSAPIGPTLDKIKELLNPWLGTAKWKITERSAKLVYKYQSIDSLAAKLKIEINTTEHFQVLPLQKTKFTIDSEWFKGSTRIVIYALEELIATKLRALYQRRKGRDLFDLWYILKNNLVDIDHVIEIFKKYCSKDNISISKNLFQKNLDLKKANQDFKVDMNTLLPPEIYWDFDEAYNLVQDQIISKLD